MLPKMDGLAILQEIRSKGIDVPVILLTAKSEIEDRVKGLDYGADDYLPKPFHAEELLARLRALQRRKPEFNNEGIVSFGDIQFSPHTLLLSCERRKVELKLKEAQLFELLIDNRNIVLSKSVIIEKVWGYDAEADGNSVEIQVSRLRKHLAHIQSRVTINTIRGMGYMLSERDR
jgi:DNA-binding response OmpR family regulator